jgi:hypothetical protein
MPGLRRVSARAREHRKRPTRLQASPHSAAHAVAAASGGGSAPSQRRRGRSAATALATHGRGCVLCAPRGTAVHAAAAAVWRGAAEPCARQGREGADVHKERRDGTLNARHDSALHQPANTAARIIVAVTVQEKERRRARPNKKAKSAPSPAQLSTAWDIAAWLRVASACAERLRCWPRGAGAREGACVASASVAPPAAVRLHRGARPPPAPAALGRAVACCGATRLRLGAGSARFALQGPLPAARRARGLARMTACRAPLARAPLLRRRPRAAWARALGASGRVWRERCALASADALSCAVEYPKQQSLLAMGLLGQCTGCFAPLRFGFPELTFGARARCPAARLGPVRARTHACFRPRSKR